MKTLQLLYGSLALAPCLGFQAPAGGFHGMLYGSQNRKRATTMRRNADVVSRLDTTSTIAEPKFNPLNNDSSSFSSRIIQVQQQRQVIAPPPTTITTTIETETGSALTEDAVYQQGLVTIGLITILFASNSPVLHMVFVNSAVPPPVWLLNAACSVVAMTCMLVAGPLLDRAVDKPSLLVSSFEQQRQDGATSTSSEQQPLQTTPFLHKNSGSSPMDQLSRLLVGIQQGQTFQAGVELGLWKFLGTLANMYGLSETSASHGAFLIQLTTLLVPLAQGIMGVPIPRVIWTAIGLALTGVAVFTQDNTGGTSLTGDLACVVAAVFYATYDLRLFHWGKLVDPLKLITTKIVTQTTLSIGALVAFGWEPSVAFWQQSSGDDANHWTLFLLATLWSGVAVNAVAPFLQVGGQQAVGPARAQILYASQPLWAAILSWAILNETVGLMGAMGGALFLSAIFLAATADSPDPNCEETICEI